MNGDVVSPLPKSFLNTDKFAVLYVLYVDSKGCSERRLAKLFENKTIQENILEISKQYAELVSADLTKYALKLTESNQYLNEKNRNEILSYDTKVTNDVTLCFNMKIEVETIIEKLQANANNSKQSENINQYMDNLHKNIESDLNFAVEFISQKGRSVLIEFIKNWRDTNDVNQWNLLYYIYKSLIALFKKLNISWDSQDVDVDIVKLICDLLNSSVKDNKLELISDRMVLLFLNLTNNIINNSRKMRDFCIKDLKYAEIIFLLKRPDVSIKESLLIVINKSFEVGDDGFKLRLHEIMEQHPVKVLFTEMVKDVRHENEIFRNIAILQKNMLKIKCEQLRKTYKDKTMIEDAIKKICDTAFSMLDRGYTYEEKYARLGFVNVDNTVKDFEQNECDLLCLKFMEHFSDTSYYTQLISSCLVENTVKSFDHLFPYAKSCLGLVKLLYELLHIGQDVEPEEQFQLFFLMFCQTVDGIYDVLTKLLMLLNRLWIEMKAQALDFDRALSVCRDSFMKLLNDVNKDTTKDYVTRINEFYKSMETWNYDKVKTIPFNEKLNRLPAKELKKILTEEVIQMLRPRRLKMLCIGNFFDIRISKKTSKPRSVFFKLSSNLEEFTSVNKEDLANDKTKENQQNLTITVSKILEIGKERIETRDRTQNAIKIKCSVDADESEELYWLTTNSDTKASSFDENAQNDQNTLSIQIEDNIDVWLNAINLLLNKPIDDKNIFVINTLTGFIECIVDTQLLDLQKLGANIPHDIPPVPPLPDNFDIPAL